MSIFSYPINVKMRNANFTDFFSFAYSKTPKRAEMDHSVDKT